jgi:hypothetical protein
MEDMEGCQRNYKDSRKLYDIPEETLEMAVITNPLNFPAINLYKIVYSNPIPLP